MATERASIIPFLRTTAAEGREEGVISSPFLETSENAFGGGERERERNIRRHGLTARLESSLYRLLLHHQSTAIIIAAALAGGAGE